MNPWALVIIALGIILVIIGVQGTQHNIASAITGHAPGAHPGGTNPGTNPGTTGILA